MKHKLRDMAAHYLDVWEREVTAAEDIGLREPALDGPDTSVRTEQERADDGERGDERGR